MRKRAPGSQLSGTSCKLGHPNNHSLFGLLKKEKEVILFMHAGWLVSVFFLLTTKLSTQITNTNTHWLHEQESIFWFCVHCIFSGRTVMFWNLWGSLALISVFSFFCSMTFFYTEMCLLKLSFINCIYTLFEDHNYYGSAFVVSHLTGFPLIFSTFSELSVFSMFFF